MDGAQELFGAVAHHVRFGRVGFDEVFAVVGPGDEDDEAAPLQAEAVEVPAALGAVVDGHLVGAFLAPSFGVAAGLGLDEVDLAVGADADPVGVDDLPGPSGAVEGGGDEGLPAGVADLELVADCGLKLLAPVHFVAFLHWGYEPGFAVPQGEAGLERGQADDGADLGAADALRAGCVPVVGAGFEPADELTGRQRRERGVGHP